MRRWKSKKIFAMKMAGVSPIIVLKKLINIKAIINSKSLKGVMNKFVKFLDQISSKNDIVRPSCPLNKTSHKTTADNIMLRALHDPKLLFEIRKLVKNPQNKI